MAAYPAGLTLFMSPFMTNGRLGGGFFTANNTGGAPAHAPSLLLEDGSYLLLEDGSTLLLE